MSDHITSDPFDIPWPLAHNRLFRTLVADPLEKLLGVRQCRDIYRQLPATNSADDFCRAVLERMNVTCALEGEGLNHIPRQGAAIVVANHPFGAIEGLVMIEALRRIRPDVKVLANSLLQRLPPLREALIGVDILTGTQGARVNIGPLRQAIRHVREGGLLLTFPAGEVSHLQLRRREVADSPWQASVGALIRHCQAPVIPVYIPGRNGMLFQAAGLVHPRLRTLLLGRMLLRQQGGTIRLRGGRPVPWSRLSECADDRERIDYLRLRTYLLGEAVTPSGSSAASGGEVAQDIISPQDADLLAEEVSRLPQSQLLVHSGALQVWQAEASQIPYLLLEIGRLREVTFRAVGEGTGRSFDLDRFDQNYLHLFLWHSERHELVGAYRVGCCDTLLERFGKQGLYTHTLFKYRRRMFDAIGPALELGRSFVRPEYQKSYSPLLLLWKGIGRFVVKNPRYRVLFGPVSITRDYCDLSRKLIAGTLHAEMPLPQLSRLVKPRVPFHAKARIRGCSGEMARSFCSNMEQVAPLVADIEVQQKGIPVLLRHYLNLGGKLLTFNLDPQFSDVLDGLILIDLLQTDQKTIQRYMGREGAAAFFTYQRLLSGRREVLCA
ncbi:MAG: lysophospholipid acyltransferase family protein [Pedobacter sp.]